MQLWAQWWLVMTKPFGDTKLPEHPPASRTADNRTWSSQSVEGPTPSRFFRRSEGTSFGSHIPSSLMSGAGAIVAFWAFVPASVGTAPLGEGAEAGNGAGFPAQHAASAAA